MREKGFEPSQALSQQLSPTPARIWTCSLVRQASSPKAAPFDHSGIPALGNSIHSSGGSNQEDLTNRFSLRSKRRVRIELTKRSSLLGYE